MPDSEFSSYEHQKKSNKNKKRRRSASIESYKYEKKSSKSSMKGRGVENKEKISKQENKHSTRDNDDYKKERKRKHYTDVDSVRKTKRSNENTDSENEKHSSQSRHYKRHRKDDVMDSRGKNSSTHSKDRHNKDSSQDNHRNDDSDVEVNRQVTGTERSHRYQVVSCGQIRKNSDSYWNKYSDRLKESEKYVEVGPRYYDSGEKSSKEKTKEKVLENDKVLQEGAPRKLNKEVDPLKLRSGGAYIPPAKLKMMQESITDKGSIAYQRIAWEALKKSIQGHVNKVNTSNIKTILNEVIKENLVRGQGLLCRSLIQAQAASPTYSNVYAAFIASLNSKYPGIGELLLKRLVVQFRRGFKRNDKSICVTAVTFIAHLINQGMAHEILALEILTLLLENPTDDSVEVAIAFIKECGMKLTELSSKGVSAIFDTLRNVLHEGKLEKRVQYMIEVMYQIRKEEFKAHPAVVEELQDVLEEGEGIQHMITLEDNHDPRDILNVFKFDPEYEANEAKYKELLGDDEESDGSGSGESGDDEASDEEEEDDDNKEKSEEKQDVIVDKTETNLIALRRTIYLTIQSSLDFEECAHKLLRMQLKPGQEVEMAHMFLDCCSEQRTYEKFYGLLSQRFCEINRSYIGPFEETFKTSYDTIHRMSNDKLRNVAKLFAHLLHTDAISWEVLATIRLNEDDTNSSSRIFIKILFMELSEYMGLQKLNQRVKDPSLQTSLEGLFPRDNPKHTRFAINFFTSIGLGGLTDDLREHLKAQPKPSLEVPQMVEELSSSSSSSSSTSSSSSSSSSSSISSSDSSDSLSSSESSSSEEERSKKSDKSKKKLTKKSSKIKESEKSKKSSVQRKRRESSVQKKRPSSVQRKQRESSIKKSDVQVQSREDVLEVR